MTTKRKQHTSQFKLKVALEATKNLKTRAQIASEFEVHATQVSQWKKELIENGPRLFETKRSKNDQHQSQHEAELYEQIGRLKMELEWLKKKSEQISP
jgi:transposase-like protein